MTINKINQKLKKESNNYPSWYLSDRQICDLELLLNGAFSPLNGFMDKQNYESVLNNMTLLIVMRLTMVMGMKKKLI